jgi:hypothetical protein
LRSIREGHNLDIVTDENGILFYNDRLWLPDENSLRLFVAESEHDSLVAGHYGSDKTIELISRNFYWPNMGEWIADYVRSCHTCQKNKSTKHARFGLLQPLEAPPRPWSSISMDFIVDLPPSEGYTSIWVIVDRYSKMAHFIPLKTPTGAEELAKIFVKEIFRVHGLPSDIVSDRDTRFTSQLWVSLCKLIGIKLKMSTAFHPQTDGSTERVNQTLEQYLRIFCLFDQSNWSQLLPLAEFAFNNISHTSTRASPFYINYGFHPRANWISDEQVKHPVSKNYAHWLKSIHEECDKALSRTRDNMGQYYDKRRKEAPPLKVGDRVLLDARNIKTKRPSKKLDCKMIGPFVIEKRLSSSVYRLVLPKSWRIHPTFHIGLLEPYREPGKSGRKDIPQETFLAEIMDIENQEDETEEFEVAEIMDSEVIDGLVKYLVRWENFPDPSEWTWEPYSHLEEKGKPNPTVIKFHKMRPEKPKDSRYRSRR